MPVAVVMLVCAPGSRTGAQPVPAGDWLQFGSPVVQRYPIGQTGVAGKPQVIRQLADRQIAFGTDRGLYLYDGRRWEEVRGHSGVHSIEPVPDGRFYLGSGSEIYVLEPDQRGGYASRALSKGLLRDRPDSIVFSLCAIGDTVYGLDGDRIIVTQPGAEPYLVTLPTWCDALFQLNGELHLRANSPDFGLLRYVPDERRFEPAPALLPRPLTESLVAQSAGADGRIWFATRSGTVYRTDGRTTEEVFLNWPVSDEPVEVESIQVLNGGWLAVATLNKGVLVFDETGSVVRRASDGNEAASRRRFYTLGTDAEGGLWLGAALELLRVDGQLPATFFGESEGLFGEVWAITRHDGRLYVGTDTGLFVQNPDAQLRREAFVQVPQIGPVHALLPSPDGLWVSSTHLLLLGRDGQVRDFGPETADANPILRPRGRPNLLLVGCGEGLIALRRGPEGWQVEGPVPGADQPVFSIAETTRGDIWISFGTGAVGRVQVRGPAAYDVGHYAAAEGIPNLWVHFGALGGEIYLGSDKGTLKWDPATDRFVPTTDVVYYGTGEPIGFDPIFNRAQDAWVWPQTTIGTLVSRPPAEALASMAIITGHVRARSRSVLRDDAGTYWIGLPAGLLHYTDRARGTARNDPAPVVLRRLEDLRIGKPITGAITRDQSLVLRHDQDSIRVVAALPRFGGERFSQFQIQMLGFDEVLPPSSAASVREFTNLPAGNYQLIIWASDGAGREAPALTIALTVLAPFYATSWAYALYAVLGVGTVIGIIRWRVGHLDRRAAELQAAVDERTAEISRQSALLHEEKELFASLAAAAPVGIWRGAADGSVVLVNAALERICARMRGPLLEEGWLPAVHPEDRPRALALMAAAVRDGNAVSAELRFQRPDGHVRWIIVGVAPVRTATDTAGSWLVGTALDVTERRDVERRMMRAQRLESIGTLTGGIAHDLNNALVPIIAGLSLLADSNNADRTTLMGDIERSAKRAASMVRQLLAFARGVEGQRVPVDLVPLATELRRILERTFPKNIALELVTEVAASWVQGDPTQLHQVLLNLCVNARDAMPNGGSLCVQLSRRRVVDALDAFQEPIPSGDYQVVRVRDTGHGIPPNVLEHIFDPFYTTKPVDHGTGLGLSTSLGIIRSHGGYIAVETEPGAGTSFFVYLPTASAPAESNGSSSGALTATPSVPCGLVLLVDDEAAIRSILKRTLERMKFKTITAADGNEALHVWNARRDEIGLLAVDLHMPGMDGIALLRSIRATSSDVPVVAFSGNISEEQRQELHGLGVHNVLAKPFLYEEFAEAVSSALSAGQVRSQAD